MRLVVLFLIGLLMGAFCTVVALNAMRSGTRYPVAMMSVLQQHLGDARGLTEGDCGGDNPLRHLLVMRALADDSERAFLPTGRDDALFGRYASDLRGSLDAAIAAADGSCAAQKAAVAQVGDSCQSCHRDFR